MGFPARRRFGQSSLWLVSIPSRGLWVFPRTSIPSTRWCADSFQSLVGVYGFSRGLSGNQTVGGIKFQSLVGVYGFSRFSHVCTRNSG